ncbi:Histidine--tRNA ligase [Buchnera aphidicola (Takecallis arundicolens)]|uniref:histidine--tRNA ligase n=1 Tax=Buchnera aphidicola TaxID=9 RepID=UPI003463CA4E
MNYFFQSIKGMHDYLPEQTILWNKIEDIFKKILHNYGYCEIKLPILEKTILFKASIGEMTDIIGKEMYSFHDKNNLSITLRPEATTSCVRSIIQNKLIYHKKQKLWYYGPMFRYERPQKGRYRQFYQFGLETFGFFELDIEFELIILVNKFWKALGISRFLTLEINSIGLLSERNAYQMELRNFLKTYESYLDNICIRQLNKNPLRILDSKNKNIQKILLKAPNLIDFVNTKSRLRFEKLCNLLSNFNIPYTINYKLIRGLDYYNDTVFEWKTNYIGSQNAICAGGRYDTLVKRLLGPDTPAAGLAIGMDRLILLIQSLNLFSQKNIETDIHIFFSNKSIKNRAIFLSEEIRNEFPKLKILLEFQSKKINTIFKNIKKYFTKIILFIQSENIIYLYDVICKKNQIINSNNINIMIKNIFNFYTK